MFASGEYNQWIVLPAFAGMMLFLLLMKHSHPASHIPHIAENREVIDSSRSFLEDSGFDTGPLEPFAVFKTNETLLDEQISHFGKRSLNDFIKNGFLRFIPTWYYEVFWITDDPAEDTELTMTGFRHPGGPPLLRTVHAPDGAVQQLEISDKKAGEHITGVPAESGRHVPGFQEIDPDAIIPGALLTEQPGTDFLKSLIRNTVWDTSLMTPDSIYFHEVHGEQLHRVRMALQTEIFSHIPTITVTYSQDGQLLGIDQNVSLSGFDGINQAEYADFIRVLFYIAGLLLLLSVFFRRLFHRLIDLKASTTYASMVAGLALFHIVFLLLQDPALFQIDQPLLSVISFLVILLFLAALTGGMAFLLSGLGESVSREVWPEKITSLSLLRLGYFKSRRAGLSVYTGISAAMIILGLAAVMYTLVDRSFLNPMNEQFFYTESYLFSVWHVAASGLFWMFIISAGLYACLVSWLALNFPSRIFLLIAGSIGLALMTSFYVSTPGSPMVLLFWLIPGLAFTYVFLKYDLLALMTSVFFFIALWAVTDGLMVSGSPDIWLAWSVPGLMILILATGWYVAEYGNNNEQIAGLTPAYIEEIAREQRVERELEIARQVHQSFLPVHLPTVSGIEVAAHCKAAFDVGGDYYDVIKVDDHRLAFVIGDVSGKGIQAAFFMTMVKGIVQSLVKEIPEPIPLLTRMNRLFYDNARRGSFISVCYALADVRDGTVRYARAGHNPGILMRQGQNSVSLIRSQGIAIGLTRNSVFEQEMTEEKISMKPGDGLIFYTDGVTEAVNTGKQMYGEERLMTAIKENLEQPPGTLLKTIDTSVTRFTGSQSPNDDMTLLIMRYNGI